MDFQKEYQQKLVSADEAVKIIKSGDWVDYGWCTGTPDALDKALAKRTDELKDVKLRGGILLKPLAVFEREDAGEHFCWNSWHMSGIERKYISRGFAYYSPIRYSELPRYYRDSIQPDDVVMLMVAPMDKHGYFNFGPNASHLTAMCETSKKIIVEVNENMPRCLGGFENGVHISDVTYIVEGDNPPIGELGGGGPATDVDKAVAKLIIDGTAEHITLPDGGVGLDIGCGSGALTIACAKRNPQGKMIGIDRWGKEYASFSLPLCEKNAAAEGVKNASFQRGNAVKLDFPDESFDAVTSNYVYHNMRGEPNHRLSFAFVGTIFASAIIKFLLI